MKDLTLSDMQQHGINKYMSDQEVEKTIFKALQEQQKVLNTTNQEVGQTMDDVLKYGGEFVYLFEGKKIRLSVLTPSDLNLLDNVDNFIQEGIEYDLLPVYKFHCKTALDNKLFIKAQTYQQAQAVVDSIFSVGQYKISDSKI